MPESPRTDPSAESALKDPWAEFLRDPIFRPTLLYSTKAFTLWQRSDGPLLQLDLVPDGALTGRTLEVGTGSGTKRGLPLKLTIQADPPWQSPRANGLGLLDFNEAGEIAELGSRWGDHISGTVRCTLEHLGRLVQLLQAYGCAVEWVVTTDHLQRSYEHVPASDWLWAAQAQPKLVVYDLAARVPSSALESGQSVLQSGQSVKPGLTECLVLLRQIKSVLESGVRVRLF